MCKRCGGISNGKPLCRCCADPLCPKDKPSMNTTAIAQSVLELARAEWKLRNKRAQWVDEGKPEWSFISSEWYARKNASNKLLAYTAKGCTPAQKRVLAQTAMGILESNKPVVMEDLVAFISQALA